MMPLRKQLMGGDPVKVSEISTGQSLPKTVHSMTAYFGAGPIVQALEMGADIVVTGKVIHSKYYKHLKKGAHQSHLGGQKRAVSVIK